MPKHTPATPLPWQDHSGQDQGRIALITGALPSRPRLMPPTSKLVEALREVQRQVKAYPGQHANIGVLPEFAQEDA